MHAGELAKFNLSVSRSSFSDVQVRPASGALLTATFNQRGVIVGPEHPGGEA